MGILSLNLFLYTICGMWRPIEMSSNLSKLLYNLLTFVTLYSLIFLLLTQFLDIFFVDNTKDRTMNILMCLSFVTILFKAAAVMFRRDRIIDIIRLLEAEPCKASNDEEIDIQMKYDRLIRSYSKNYIFMSILSIMGIMVGALLDALDGKLPYSMWVPYDYSSSLTFWATYFQSNIAVILVTTISVATETSVLAFCLQMCAQFEILRHRLERMMQYKNREFCKLYSVNNTSHKSSRLSEHVSHHLSIIRIAGMINDVFSETIFVQFFISILILSLFLYHLSVYEKLSDISILLASVACMFVQIFIYCWAGNEVTLKSTKFGDDVYQTDWTLMTVGEQRDLLMIMRRSLRSIKFSSGFFVTMSLDSYTTLLKASYSAFNVLQ